jgi:translation elongation factor EF-4
MSGPVLKKKKLFKKQKEEKEKKRKKIPLTALPQLVRRRLYICKIPTAYPLF